MTVRDWGLRGWKAAAVNTEKRDRGQGWIFCVFTEHIQAASSNARNLIAFGQLFGGKGQLAVSSITGDLLYFVRHKLVFKLSDKLQFIQTC